VKRIDVGCAKLPVLKPNYHRRYSYQRRNGFRTRLYECLSCLLELRELHSGLCGQRWLFVFNIAVLVLAVTYTLLKGNVVASTSLDDQAERVMRRAEYGRFSRSSLEYLLSFIFRFCFNPEMKMNLCLSLLKFDRLCNFANSIDRWGLFPSSTNNVL
jgi:hypothetical protein